MKSEPVKVNRKNFSAARARPKPPQMPIIIVEGIRTAS